ncbi:MAG: NAD-dependent deacetylase [Promethearchaeota archaeon]
MTTDLLENIKQSRKMVALTGAGISKGSGMPTFRGVDGLWRNYNAQELATPYAFDNNPELVWSWYQWRISKVLNVDPNPAHLALTQLEKDNRLTAVITQNVDGLHSRAGTKNLVELHGNILRAHCTGCSHHQMWSAADFELLPRCPDGHLLRPSVVWFGELLNPEKIKRAQSFLKQCEVLFILGTSGIVYPAAAMPEIAKSQGALICEFNIEKTPLSALADIFIEGPCEKTFPVFLEKLELI